MKKSIFLSLLLLLPVFMAAQTRKVAILETVDRENTLSYGVKLMVRSHLAEAVTNTPGYEAYDRTNLQQIFDEQEFQRTGFVSDEDIKKIGEMTGVQYVLVAEASKLDERNLFITAKILNVETARVEKTANTMSLTDIPSLQKAAQDLASRLLADIKPADSKKVTSVSASDGAIIKREGINDYYIGGEWASRKMYYQFLEDNKEQCRRAYHQYQKGHKMTKAGWSLLGIGAACMLTGGICWGASGSPGIKSFENGGYDDDFKAGFCLLIIGTAPLFSSIPLLSVGYSKKNNAYKLYNESCAPKKTAAVTLNLQSSRNGIGLALCF